jgi:hypothetical protein
MADNPGEVKVEAAVALSGVSAASRFIPSDIVAGFTHGH